MPLRNSLWISLCLFYQLIELEPLHSGPLCPVNSTDSVMNRSMDIFLKFHVGCPITFEAVEAVEAGLIERMGDLLSH